VPAVGGTTGGGSVAIDGGKGDAAEGGCSPVSARAPADGRAAVGGGEVAEVSTGAEGTVVRSELARLRRKATRMRTAGSGGWQFS